MKQDVTCVVDELKRLTEILCINISSIRIVQLTDENFILGFSTSNGDYEIPFVSYAKVKDTFTLTNFILRKRLEINSLADSLIDSIVVNLVINKDVNSAEIFFHALVSFWDAIFINTHMGMDYRIPDAIAMLRKYIYLNDKGETEAKKWIKYPADMMTLITGPSANRIYYMLGLQMRDDMQRIRKGETF